MVSTHTYKEKEGIEFNKILVFVDMGTCLCLLFDDGTLSCYSLPKIDPIFESKLPEHVVSKRLPEASLSQDGRIVIWTGQYEMEQYQFMTNPKM